jgi:hypothetical protein
MARVAAYALGVARVTAANRETLVTADLHPSDKPGQRAGSTRDALDKLITETGARPIASAEDVDRFRTSLWNSDEELQAFLVDLRASRNAGI